MGGCKVQTGKTIALLGKMGHNCWRNLVCPNFINRTNPFEIRVGQHALQYIGPFYNPCHGNTFASSTAREIRAWVKENALTAIRQADYVFAYIDDATCYGTIYELGFAMSRGKQLGIAFSSDTFATELWFADPEPTIAVNGKESLEDWLNKQETGK
jgi:hypothetical protein